MSSLNFKTENNSTKSKVVLKTLLFVFFSLVQVKVKAWEVDMSRRTKELQRSRMPASIVDVQASEKDSGLVSNFFESLEPTQEIVILQTETGFVPETVRLKMGSNYRIHVVNVNEKEKNTSFILDSFSEHHATYFGLKKSFSLKPKAEGIFSFVSPETGKQGRLVIVGADPAAARVPASK